MSLPRPDELVDLRYRNASSLTHQLPQTRVHNAIEDVVATQLHDPVDIVNDGETGKVG